MTIGNGNPNDADDILVEHNSDGTHKNLHRYTDSNATVYTHSGNTVITNVYESGEFGTADTLLLNARFLGRLKTAAGTGRVYVRINDGTTTWWLGYADPDNPVTLPIIFKTQRSLGDSTTTGYQYVGGSSALNVALAGPAKLYVDLYTGEGEVTFTSLDFAITHIDSFIED